MSHLWDALPAQYRPLAFYALTEFGGVLTRIMMRVSATSRGVGGGSGGGSGGVAAGGGWCGVKGPGLRRAQ
jgi:hypothetical protein